MSWKTSNQVGLREEFVQLAKQAECNFSALCRRFNISRKTGYKWRQRWACGAGLQDRLPARTRRANQTTAKLERTLLQLRAKYPTWGPRKLRAKLRGRRPAVSSVARLLKRSGCITPSATTQHQPGKRFARAHPNELWQMDFKGHFAMHAERCHPLTILDDCSRYLLGLFACANETGVTVQARLTQLFQRYGLPAQILCDNGSPWGRAGGSYTVLEVWLLRLGIHVIHGRPYHPQTQGKDERFHRTLKYDLLQRHDWRDLRQAQRRFDAFRRLYNHDRPHDALNLDVPAQHYRVSPRSFPTVLPPIQYAAGQLRRNVDSKGVIIYRNRHYYIGEAFGRLPLALRPTATADHYRVCLGAHTLGLIQHLTPDPFPYGHSQPLHPYPTP
jgi:transposase InsO family protein